MPNAIFSPIRLLKSMTRRVIGNVDRCIYCDALEDLRDEHVIPYSLGGRDELLRATCGRCADITSAFEMRLTRSPAWWPLRRALDLNSRHKKKQPTFFSARDVSGAEPRTLQIPIGQYPLLVPFFVFDAPGILTGADGAHPVGRIMLWHPRKLPTNFPRLQMDVYPNGDFGADLARLLAKIALGYAVAANAIDAFEDIFVKELILGDVSRASAWVGGHSEPPNFNGDAVHASTTNIVDNQVRVLVQLFRAPPGLAQTPVYQVVVGKIRPTPGSTS